MYIRLGIILLKPPRSQLICLHRPTQIPQLHLIQLGQILLMRRRPPKIPLHRVMPDRLLKHPRRILRLILPVALIRLRQRVRRVVGLFELVLLECSGFLEALPGFLGGLLEPEGVGCLGVEVYGCFVFFGFTAEEGEAAAG